MRAITEPENMATLALRIRWIIAEQQIKQIEFARTLGISANYVYLLTSARKTSISEPLARLIESTYGYSAAWLLTGKKPQKHATAYNELQKATIRKVKRMNETQLLAVANFIHSLQNENKE